MKYAIGGKHGIDQIGLALIDGFKIASYQRFVLFRCHGLSPVNMDP
jgi:hypothetical protein